MFVTRHAASSPLYIYTHIYYIYVLCHKHIEYTLEFVKETYMCAKKICIDVKETCIYVKETCIYVKEICTYVKETCIYVKETYIYVTRHAKSSPLLGLYFI